MAFCSSSLVVNAASVRVSLRKEGRGALLTFFTQSGLHTDFTSGQARNTTVQVWTVGEGFGIGSEFRQTCCAANNFRDHQVFFVGSSAPVPHGTRIVLTRRKTRCGLTSADSGLQLDLEIALNGVSAKIQPPPAFQPGRKCVETSDDVIEDDFTSNSRQPHIGP